MKRLIVLFMAMLVICSTAFGDDITWDKADLIDIGNLQVADTFFFVIGSDTIYTMTKSGALTAVQSWDNSGFIFNDIITMDGNAILMQGGEFAMGGGDITSARMIEGQVGVDIIINSLTSGKFFIHDDSTKKWTFSDESLIGESGSIISGLDHIVFNDGTNNMRESGLDTWAKEYWFPDLITDTVVFFEVDSSKYPFGITIKNASILTSVAGVYALQMRQYTAADPPVASNWVDTLNVVAGKTRISSTTFTDATVPRGTFVYINTPDNNIDWIHVKILFFANES